MSVSVAPKLSGVEALKRQSHQLRGTIAATIADDAVSVFTEDEYNLLKFHGVYEQYDRDTATPRKQAGLDKEYSCMVRTRVPGGRLTPDQYLSLDSFADELSNGSLRVTTRQTIQFHGVLKGNLATLMQRINERMMTTFAACGDVVRNVTATPAPIKDEVHATLDRTAAMLSTALLPCSTAYHEIWIDGEKVESPAEVEEPLYGATYLPRKFKIGLATPDDNSVDVLTNDVGIVALFNGQVLEGYNVAVGGGLGITHNKPKTYPRLATPLLFVEPDGLLGAVEAIIKVQRDHGDRTDRKHARLKYVVDEKGLPWMRGAVETMAGRSYRDPRPMPRFAVQDHLGWHAQGDGLHYLGIPVPSGRIKDAGAVTLRSALRGIVAKFRPLVILTPNQDVILGDVKPRDRLKIDKALRAAGVTPPDSLKPLQRWSLACPALPTCGLALTEAERVREPIVDGVLARLTAYGLEDERIALRITGCPNGCARPYAGDIGLVGRMPGYYALYVGGDFEGTRLNFRLLDRVAEAEVPVVLDPLFAGFSEGRAAGEGFGDWCNRVGEAGLRGLIAAATPAVAAE